MRFLDRLTGEKSVTYPMRFCRVGIVCLSHLLSMDTAICRPAI